MNHAEPRIGGRHLRENLTGAVGRSVVENDKFETGIFLPEQRLQRFPYLFLLIPCGHNDGEARHCGPPLARSISQISCGTVAASDIDSPQQDNAKRNRRQNGKNRLPLLIHGSRPGFEPRVGSHSVRRERLIFGDRGSHRNLWRCLGRDGEKVAQIQMARQGFGILAAD